MSLGERVLEAMGSVTPARFAAAIGVSKAAMSLILSGTTKTLKHDTALAIERVTGYRAEWINTGRGPQRLNTAEQQTASYTAMTAREEMMLDLFRSLTPEQQRELVVDTNAMVTANREIQARFLNQPIKTFSNEDVAAAFGPTPAPKPSRKAKPKKRPGVPDEDPE